MMMTNAKTLWVLLYHNKHAILSLYLFGNSWGPQLEGYIYGFKE